MESRYDLGERLYEKAKENIQKNASSAESSLIFVMALHSTDYIQVSGVTDMIFAILISLASHFIAVVFVVVIDILTEQELMAVENQKDNYLALLVTGVLLIIQFLFHVITQLSAQLGVIIIGRYLTTWSPGTSVFTDIVPTITLFLSLFRLAMYSLGLA